MELLLAIPCLVTTYLFIMRVIVLNYASDSAFSCAILRIAYKLEPTKD